LVYFDFIINKKNSQRPLHVFVSPFGCD